MHDFLQVLKAGLHCAQLLAGTDLVHRDLRLPNFFWDKDTPFVGDLELAAKAPLQVPFQLCLLMRPKSQLELRYVCIAGGAQTVAYTEGLD